MSNITIQFHDHAKRGTKGVVDKHDVVTIKDGNKPRQTVAIKEFLSSKKFEYLGSPSQRLALVTRSGNRRFKCSIAARKAPPTSSPWRNPKNTCGMKSKLSIIPSHPGVRGKKVKIARRGPRKLTQQMRSFVDNQNVKFAKRGIDKVKPRQRTGETISLSNGSSFTLGARYFGLQSHNTGKESFNPGIHTTGPAALK